MVNTGNFYNMIDVVNNIFHRCQFLWKFLCDLPPFIMACFLFFRCQSFKIIVFCT